MTIVRNQRIRGAKLGLTVAGVDRWADLVEAGLEPESKDKDVLTFADALAGATAKWSLKGSAIQSTSSTSFWRWCWENSGKEVDFILAPHGNKTASEEEPHFKGRVKIGAKPPIGKKADEEKGSTFSFDWDCTGEPEMVTSESTLGSGNVEDSLA